MGVEPVGDGGEGHAVFEEPGFDLVDDLGLLGEGLEDGGAVVFATGGFLVAVGGATEARVQSADGDAGGHFIAVVFLQCGNFLPGDDVAQADGEADLVLAFFGVLGRGDRFAGIGEYV